jgi:endonuclease YncB( thermonuclease family)
MSNPPSMDDLYTYLARIERTIDGDTVVISIDLGCDVWLLHQHCRLTGINAPEKTGETKERGLASKEHLEALLKGHETVLVRTTYDRKCTFGRLLVELFVGEYSINEEMVEDNFANNIGVVVKR